MFIENSWLSHRKRCFRLFCHEWHGHKLDSMSRKGAQNWSLGLSVIRKLKGGLRKRYGFLRKLIFGNCMAFFRNFTVFFGNFSVKTNLRQLISDLRQLYGFLQELTFGKYEESKSNIKPARTTFCRSQNRHVYIYIYRSRHKVRQYPTPTYPPSAPSCRLQYCKKTELYFLKHANNVKIAK